MEKIPTSNSTKRLKFEAESCKVIQEKIEVNKIRGVLYSYFEVAS